VSVRPRCGVSVRPLRWRVVRPLRWRFCKTTRELGLRGVSVRPLRWRVFGPSQCGAYPGSHYSGVVWAERWFASLLAGPECHPWPQLRQLSPSAGPSSAELTWSPTTRWQPLVRVNAELTLAPTTRVWFGLTVGCFNARLARVSSMAPATARFLLQQYRVVRS
jgi:hypothetical protein